jgi:hypothetical protein
VPGRQPITLLQVLCGWQAPSTQAEPALQSPSALQATHVCEAVSQNAAPVVHWLSLVQLCAAWHEPPRQRSPAWHWDELRQLTHPRNASQTPLPHSLSWWQTGAPFCAFLLSPLPQAASAANVNPTTTAKNRRIA